MTATSSSGLAPAAEACDHPRSQESAASVGKGRPGVVLAALFVVAAAYSALQSRAHVTPAIYMDELMFEKLAQSFAGGHPFEIRGQTEFFPSFLAALLASPAWLVENVATAYAIAKALNAVLMASAVFPVYWLARQLVRPSWALVAAAAAAASPALLYHSYLLSEAPAYPMFFLGLAVGVCAIARPSPRWGMAVVGVSLIAVATRAQLVALPIAYLVGVAVCGRKELRLHTVGVGGLVVVGTLGLAGGAGLLGPYLGAVLLDYSPAEVGRWIGVQLALLPWAAGLVVVPGAALGLGYLLARPRTREERAFGVVVAAVVVVTLIEIGLVNAADAQFALERYAIYLPPLLAISFLAYADRGAPLRRLYAGFALGLGFAAWVVPLSSWADFRFTFTSPTLSTYGVLAVWIGHANAATVFAGAALAAGILVALVPLRGRAAPVLGLVAASLLLLSGVAAYAGDHAMTRRTVTAWIGSPPDWLDASGLGPADYLELPGGSPQFGWAVEAWNRDFGGLVRLGVPPNDVDAFAAAEAQIARDGRLLVDGEPVAGGVIVVGDYATRVGLEGEVVARPRAGVTAWRVPAGARVGWLASGLSFDGWAAGTVRYQVWPRDEPSAGVYRVELELPEGKRPRTVRLAVDGGAARAVRLTGGERVTVVLPAKGYPIPVLRIRTDQADFLGGGTPNPRVVSVRIPTLEFVPA